MPESSRRPRPSSDGAQTQRVALGRTIKPPALQLANGRALPSAGAIHNLGEAGCEAVTVAAILSLAVSGPFDGLAHEPDATACAGACRVPWTLRRAGCRAVTAWPSPRAWPRQR
jgi:hypothetical protein